MKRYLFTVMWDLIFSNFYADLEELNYPEIQKTLKDFKAKKGMHETMPMTVLNIITLDNGKD